MRLDSKSEAARPPGRRDMGGSGAPAPSTPGPGEAGCDPPDADGEALGEAEAVAGLVCRDRSGVGGSGAAARPVDPAVAASDAVGAGCEGRPATTRWVVADASG